MGRPTKTDDFPIWESRGGFATRRMISGERRTFRAPTKTKLRQDVNDAIHEANKRQRGVAIVEHRPRTFNELVSRLLEVDMSRESSQATLKSNLKPAQAAFGHEPLEAITRYRIQQFMKFNATVPREGTERILAKTTQSNYLSALWRALQFAVQNEWLDRNRADGLSIIIDDTEPDPWESWEDVFAICGGFDLIGWPIGRRISLFGGGLGLRPQEFLAGRHCDALPTGEFFVRRTWDDTLRKEVELTKTRGSRAILPMTTLAREGLDGLPPALPVTDWRQSPLLFSHPDGSFITPDYFRGKWNLAVAAAGLPHKPPSSLRATFGTLTLLRLGVEHIKTVAILMRHDSYRTTEDYYLGLVEEMRRRAAGQHAQAGEPSYDAFLQGELRLSDAASL